MKFLNASILICLLTGTAFAQPINYQGRLSDKSGTNVNGTKNFSLRIYDGKTGGKQIYEENVGAVTVNEGAYSFNFGGNGKSVVTPTETIAFADGEKQIFNYTVKNPPVLGEIKISGGGYSWTESGSSNATKFTATVNKQSGAVSAIFLQAAPKQGQEIKIDYNYLKYGIMPALSRGGQAWLEITVGGETLSPRERLVAVPFALRASIADKLSGQSPLTKLFSYSFNNSSLTQFGNQLIQWRTAIPYSGNEFIPFVQGFESGYISELENQEPKTYDVHIPDGTKSLNIYLKCKMTGPISTSSIGAGNHLPLSDENLINMDNHKIKIKFTIGNKTQVVNLESKGKFADAEVVLKDPPIGLMGLSLKGNMNLVGSKRYLVHVANLVLYGS